MIDDSIIEHIKEYEGYSAVAYRDSVGKLTVGYGRNLDDNPLTDNELISLFQVAVCASGDMVDDFFLTMLENDIHAHQKEMMEEIPWASGVSEDVLLVMTDMAYNLGIPTLLSFEGMLHSIYNEDYETATYELLDSQYAEQVKTRAASNAKILGGSDYTRAVEMLKNSNISRYRKIEQYL